MLKVADYVMKTKEALGDVHMSDRELGRLLGGFASSTISGARYGNMSDPLAIRLADVLKEKGLDIERGELLMVARLEREKDETVKDALQAWALKTFATMPAKNAHSLSRVIAGGVVAGSLAFGAVGPSPAQAAPVADNLTPVCLM